MPEYSPCNNTHVHCISCIFKVFFPSQTSIIAQYEHYKWHYDSKLRALLLALYSKITSIIRQCLVYAAVLRCKPTIKLFFLLLVQSNNVILQLLLQYL